MKLPRQVGTRTSAFLVKEMVVALGQPRLILSLIVGPFLLLFLFGIGFRGRPSDYDVVLVVPESPRVPLRTDAYRQFFLWSLRLVDVTTSEAYALDLLNRREVDVVVMAPRQPLRQLAMDEPAIFSVYINHLDPLDRSRINGLAFGHTRELNALLVAAILDGILHASGLRESDSTALENLRAEARGGDRKGSRCDLEGVRGGGVILALLGGGVQGVG